MPVIFEAFATLYIIFVIVHTALYGLVNASLWDAFLVALILLSPCLIVNILHLCAFFEKVIDDLKEARKYGSDRRAHKEAATERFRSRLDEAFRNAQIPLRTSRSGAFELRDDDTLKYRSWTFDIKKDRPEDPFFARIIEISLQYKEDLMNGRNDNFSEYAFPARCTPSRNDVPGLDREFKSGMDKISSQISSMLPEGVGFRVFIKDTDHSWQVYFLNDGDDEDWKAQRKEIAARIEAMASKIWEELLEKCDPVYRKFFEQAALQTYEYRPKIESENKGKS